MQGNQTRLQYAVKSVSRAGMRTAIAPLVTWQPMEHLEDGYTVLIGCVFRLQSMIPANLRMLSRQQAPNCREILLCIDCERHEVAPDFEARVQQAAGRIPVRCVYYTPAQRRVTRAIDWGWVYAWLNWSLGIANTRTRYAMLHDFDALLLDPNALEARYRAIVETGVEYLGMDYYSGLGVLPQDRLVKTFELMFDCAFVRRSFRPIQLFNTMARLPGRRIEYDTFLNAQATAGRTAVLPIDQTEMVHPSQMICQYVDFTAGRQRIPPATNNLLMIPFYEYLGGDDSLMRQLTGQLRGDGGSATLWGRQLDVSRLSQAHAAWIRKQGHRAEREIFGDVRPVSSAYFDAIDRWAGKREPSAAVR